MSDEQRPIENGIGIGMAGEGLSNDAQITEGITVEPLPYVVGITMAEGETPLGELCLLQEWMPAFRLARAWERASTLARLRDDHARADRYLQRAADIYDLLGAQAGEDWRIIRESEVKP